MSTRDEHAAGSGRPIQALRRLSLFGALSADSISFLFERCDEVAVPSGGVFFEQGESSDCVFVLRSGSVEVVRSSGSRSLVLAEFGPGAVFGEVALVAIAPRTATARAVDDAVALRLRHHSMLELCEHNLQDFALLQMNLAREVARRLAIADETLFEHLGREED